MKDTGGRNTLEQGIAAAKAGSRLVARLHLTNAAEKHPHDSRCWLWLAWMAETPAEAVASLQKVLALDPDNEIAWAGLRWAQGMAASPRVDGSLAPAGHDRTVAMAVEPLAASPMLAPAPAPPPRPATVVEAAPSPGVAHPSPDIEERHRLPVVHTPEPPSVPTTVEERPTAKAVAFTAPAATPPSLATVEDQEDGFELAAREPDRPTVLVVDDSPTVCKLVTITLSKHGFQVATSADGAEAVSAIAASKPDLILLDINMPRLDGYKLCKLVRSHQDTRHIPVIMLSGKDGFFDKTRGKLVGCTDYITKPFDPDTLIQTVRKYAPTPAPIPAPPSAPGPARGGGPANGRTSRYVTQN